MADRSSAKSPPGDQAGKHKFHPQHKSKEPEGNFHLHISLHINLLSCCCFTITHFRTNQEKIHYFLEVLTIKREKYASIVPIKEKPLSSNWTEFVLHYWPGMMNCCGHIFTSCKEFQVHFNASHLPPKKIPRPKVVDPSAAFPGPALKPEAVSQSIPSVATSPVSSRSPSQGKQRSREQLAIESAPSRNGMI